MIEFEMTEADLAELLDAMKPVPMIAINCGPTASVQQRANAAWARLGAKMGFDPMTARPSRPGHDRYFYAAPVAAAQAASAGW